MSDANVRLLQSDDLSALIHLENLCFNASWSETQLQKQLNGERNIGFAYLINQKVSGFVIFSTLFDEAELLQIGIDPALQGQGLAGNLLTQAHRELQTRQITRILLEVRDSNRAAISLYHRLGYQQDGIRKAYYPAEQGAAGQGREDAVLMSCNL